MQGNGASNKITVDRAYLDEAEARGAVIRPQHSVTRIVPNADGYSVEFTHTLDGARHHGSLRARVVVVSAGTLGTVRLLLAARDRDRALPNISAALGARFSTNGDSGVLLVGPRWPLESGPAPVATAWLDYWESDRLFLMDLGPLPVWKKRLAQLLPTLLWLRHRGRQAASPHAWIIGTMGFDHSPGRLFLDRYGRMRHAIVRDDGGIAQRTRLRLKQLAEAAGATLLAPPTRPITRRSVTVHPLGGCALADSPQHGVCDPSGQVFGYPNLYLSDGSLLPTATGRPPSMTIAAVAERVAEGIIRRL
jgi:cholesterol oxidase